MSIRIANKKLLALVIALTISLSLAQIGVPVGASALVGSLSLSSEGSGTSAWSTVTSHEGLWAIRLTAPGQATWNATLGKGEGVNEGRISIVLDPWTTLGDLDNISWWVNTTSGYPPHADLLLDIDGNGVFDGGNKDLVTGEALGGVDDVLVAEFAYQPYLGPGYKYVQSGEPYGHYDPVLQVTHYNPAYGMWVETFQNSTSEVQTGIIDNSTVCWLYSGLPGPYTGGFFGTLEDFKEGAVNSIDGGVPAGVNASTVVLEIQIEVDNWLGAAEVYIDDVTLNGEAVVGELLPPKIEVVNPKAKTYSLGEIPVEVNAMDLFGVDMVWFNVKNGSGHWIYAENQTYTTATHLSGLNPDDYTFLAWSNNTLGVTGSKSVSFTVYRRDLSVEIHPETLNLKSRGRWVTVYITPPEGYDADDVVIETVKLIVGDNELEAEWGNVENECMMVKFSRLDLQELLEPGESVELVVTGELADGADFESSDTIRVIGPPSGNQGQNGKCYMSDPETGNDNKGGNGNSNGNKGGNGNSNGNKGGNGNSNGNKGGNGNSNGNKGGNGNSNGNKGGNGKD
ncbi:hypothetical protein MCGE09_00157 [Thaumarchaeota archaeon SCGC AB-539-E09]|nr:hypothetical protein MCGE09_00157 [Thaumarchaeota archaeon SCGC AB-539-E09]